MRTVLTNFRIVDETQDFCGTVVIEDGLIAGVTAGEAPRAVKDAAMIIDGRSLSGNAEPAILMPAFVDLHAHLRDPMLCDKNTSLPSETLEAALFAAAAGGFGTVVSMANTRPTIDSIERAIAVKRRTDSFGLVDCYPVLSLSRNLEGKELSGFKRLPERDECAEAGAKANGEAGAGRGGLYLPLMLSEDGKDITSDELFLEAMKEAQRVGIPVSCHCDFGGEEAAAAKRAGLPMSVWSRIEEINAVQRVIELGKRAGCHIHIAHVSTLEAAEMIRQEKAILATTDAGKTRGKAHGFTLTCEVTPHHLSLTNEDAERLGEESWGRVNPPLRGHEDRHTLIEALAGGVIDAIATDHAPHFPVDKETGAPGFSAFETAFAVAYTTLVRPNTIGLQHLSALMSANPTRLVGLDSGRNKRGRIRGGFRADLVVVDNNVLWTVEPSRFKSRGQNSPFAGRLLHGKVLMTIHSGRVVFQGL